MVDFSAFQKETYKATITKVQEMTLKAHLIARELSAKAIAKFNNLDREHLIITGDMKGSKIEGFYLIPQFQGFMKSNIRQFIERNELPSNTDDWIGKEADVILDKMGFPRWAVN